MAQPLPPNYKRVLTILGLTFAMILMWHHITTSSTTKAALNDTPLDRRIFRFAIYFFGGGAVVMLIFLGFSFYDLISWIGSLFKGWKLKNLDYNGNIPGLGKVNIGAGSSAENKDKDEQTASN